MNKEKENHTMTFSSNTVKGFLQIAEMVEQAMDVASNKEDYSLQDVLDTDSLARQYVNQHIK